MFGINIIRALQVSQLARDSAHMYAYGIDFSQPQNVALLQRLSSSLGISQNSGPGAIVLSTITLATQSDCDAANMKACPNRNKYVFTSIYTFGNQSLAQTKLGSPAARYFTNGTTIQAATYLSDSALVATAFSDLLTFRPTSRDSMRSFPKYRWTHRRSAGAISATQDPMHAPSFELKRSERGAALILFTIMLALVVLPMVGLGIDAGIAYMAHARLTAAADAAALAGARALNVGQDFAAQKSNAESIARQYFYANFPTGLLNSSDASVSPVATETGDHIRQVSVSASANVGLYFMPMLGHDKAAIQASAITTRRDVNVVLTLDRSGSMSGVCETMKSDAENFVLKFTNNRDTLGLVTFMGGASVNFDSTKQFKPALNDELATLRCGGNTGSAEALTLAHQQIKKVAEPGALNVIVFFTDGVPNGFTGDFAVKPGKVCPTNIKVPGTVRGYIAQGGGIYDSVATAAQSISSTNTPLVPNCPSGSLTQLGNSYAYIPESDSYGNSASATGYAAVNRNANGNIGFSTTNSDAVSANAADDAARQIREDGIFIYVIGLGSNEGVDNNLLKKIANDPIGARYNSSQPAGKYYFSPNAGQLGAAFNAIAFEILRIYQ